MRLKIRQSYLGNNEYKYELLDGRKLLGEIIVDDFSWYCLELGTVVQYKDDNYVISRIYDCDKSPDQDEVIIYELRHLMVDVYIELEDS